MDLPYDAILVVSFGGPEGPDDVIPFLERVTRGRGVPRERLLEVAAHYEHFGGVSPINAQNRSLVAALEADLAAHGAPLPVYLGNRNWHPLLADTLRDMSAAGVRKALAFVTSAFSSFSGCRQYLENIEQARAEVGKEAPIIDKLRVFYNHPRFIEASRAQLTAALARIPAERRERAPIVFTAHSIPMAMARQCQYEPQLREACRLTVAPWRTRDWRLVYQSRSGDGQVPWLEPDISAAIDLIAASGAKDIVISPIGFVTDHMEVLYDLDTEALDQCHQVGLNMIRAQTVGSHPAFLQMVRELVLERLDPQGKRPVAGECEPWPDVCPADCCPSGRPRLN